MQHVTLYRQPGRFAGWPANYGIWSWGDEILVGFTVGFHRDSGGFHASDSQRPFTTLLARSLDGGLSWDVNPFAGRTPGSRAYSVDEHVVPALAIGDPFARENAPGPVAAPVPFDHPDFALLCARTGLEAGAVSWFYTSLDRGRSWDGPFALPSFGLTGVAARTDYIVESADSCLLFLTAAKSNGAEGRPFCARLSQGGQQIDFLSWIGPEPQGYAIMPAGIWLGGVCLQAALRWQEPGGATGIDLYQSLDSTPAPNTGKGGNPPALLRLNDGRLCLIYGFRDALSGIRARLSADQGRTWSREIILRDDGGGHDLGYVRAVQRADGAVVAVYYFHDSPAGERYIAATIWQP